MKTLDKELLGFTVPITGVCETLEELIAACGSPERVVDLANNYVLYHQHYTKGRDTIVETLVKLTGKKLEGIEDPKTKKFKVTEKDTEYVGRIEDELVEENKENPEVALLGTHEEAVAAAVGAITVDYKQPVRGTGTGSVIAKKYLAYYDAMVQENKLDGFVAKHELVLTGDEEADKIVVAKKVKELLARAQQAAAQAALAV